MFLFTLLAFDGGDVAVAAAAVAGVATVVLGGAYAYRRLSETEEERQRRELEQTLRDLDNALERRGLEAVLESPPAQRGRPAEPIAQEPPGRYANVRVRSLDGSRRPATILPDSELMLLVDIGPPGPSDVERTSQTPLPDEQILPRGAVIDIVASSNDFLIAGDESESGLFAHTMSAQLILPIEGEGQATTRDGRTVLAFRVLVPSSLAGERRLRLSYFHRDLLLQSQVLKLRKRPKRGTTRNWELLTDFTLGDPWAALPEIARRPRATVIVNQTGTLHELTCRSRTDGTATSDVFRLGPEADEVARELREVLHDRAPEEVRRSPRELRRDLRALVPLGSKLNRLVGSGTWEVLKLPWQEPDDFVLSIVRPVGSDFTLPWSYVYDLPLSDDALDNINRVPFCPLVSEWDGREPLVTDTSRRCPHWDQPDHREGNLLCPYGFWGYRYSIENISQRRRPTERIALPRDAVAAAILTQTDVDLEELNTHIGHLNQFVQSAFRRPLDPVARSKREALDALGEGASLFYFFCHGEGGEGSSTTTLGIGRKETLSANEIAQRLDLLGKTSADGSRPWDSTTPLVLLNACHSLEMYADTTTSYVDAFVTEGRAAGVIGTEARVWADLAYAMGELLLREMLAAGVSGQALSLDDALRAARWSFLSSGNLFGLVYTPYSFATLQFEIT